MVGMHAARCTNLVLEECDLLVGLGIRFDDRATGKAAEFCPRAKIVHVDIDAERARQDQAAVSRRSWPTSGEALRALEPRVAADDAYRRGCAASRRSARAHPLAMRGADDPLDPYGIIRHTAALVRPDAIVTTDVGQHQMWAAQAYPVHAARASG